VLWDVSTFSNNRDRLLAGDMAQAILAAVVAQPRVKALMSSEHFSVGGTLIQAWVSHESLPPAAEDSATRRRRWSRAPRSRACRPCAVA
jgi:hypothetical protein